MKIPHFIMLKCVCHKTVLEVPARSGTLGSIEYWTAAFCTPLSCSPIYLGDMSPKPEDFEPCFWKQHLSKAKSFDYMFIRYFKFPAQSCHQAKIHSGNWKSYSTDPKVPKCIFNAISHFDVFHSHPVSTLCGPHMFFIWKYISLEAPGS